MGESDDVDNSNSGGGGGCDDSNEEEEGRIAGVRGGAKVAILTPEVLAGSEQRVPNAADDDDGYVSRDDDRSVVKLPPPVRRWTLVYSTMITLMQRPLRNDTGKE